MAWCLAKHTEDFIFKE